jgi:hypothetical protein
MYNIYPRFYKLDLAKMEMKREESISYLLNEARTQENRFSLVDKLDNNGSGQNSLGIIPGIKDHESEQHPSLKI